MATQDTKPAIHIELPTQISAAPDTAAPTQAPATPHAPSAAPPPIAAQIAPALLHLVNDSSGVRMVLELNPQSLGHIAIAISQPVDGKAQVNLTVERPETLALLQQDSTQLNHALDRAGLPAEGRSVSFHLAPPPPPATDSPAAITPTASPDTQQTTNFGTSFGQSGHHPSGGDPRPYTSPRSIRFGVPDDPAPLNIAAPTPSALGLNITA
jgi:hypothetical protein